MSHLKTKASNRSVIFPAPVLGVLKIYKASAISQWMFPSTKKESSPQDPAAVRKKLSTILKRAECKHIHFHDLRHTFSTTALQNGVDVKTVSSMLGHYDAGFTLRTYTPATRQKQDEATQTMGSFMAQVM